MQLLIVTLLFLLVGIIAFIWGAVGLSKYAFRISTGKGLGVLLFPPYTFYFAFYQLEEEGKSLPTSMWAFGIVCTILFCTAFWQPLSLTFTGHMAEVINKPSGAGAVVASQVHPKDGSDGNPGSADNNAAPANTGSATAAAPAAQTNGAQKPAGTATGAAAPAKTGTATGAAAPAAKPAANAKPAKK